MDLEAAGRALRPAATLSVYLSIRRKLAATYPTSPALQITEVLRCRRSTSVATRKTTMKCYLTHMHRCCHSSKIMSTLSTRSTASWIDGSQKMQPLHCVHALHWRQYPYSVDSGPSESDRIDKLLRCLTACHNLSDISVNGFGQDSHIHLKNSLVDPKCKLQSLTAADEW